MKFEYDLHLEKKKKTNGKIFWMKNMRYFNKRISLTRIYPISFYWQILSFESDVNSVKWKQKQTNFYVAILIDSATVKTENNETKWLIWLKHVAQSVQQK